MASPNDQLNNQKSEESSIYESETELYFSDFDELNNGLESEDVSEELNDLKIDDSAPRPAPQSESGSATAENKEINEAESVNQEEEDIRKELEEVAKQLVAASLEGNEEDENAEALNIREDGESQDSNADADSLVSASAVDYSEESVAGDEEQSMPEELSTLLESATLPRITRVSATRHLLVAWLDPPIYLELHDPPFVSLYTFSTANPLRHSFNRRMSVTFVRYDFENGGFMVEFVIFRGELERSDGTLASHTETIALDLLFDRLFNDFSLATSFFRRRPDFIVTRNEVLES